MLTGVYWPKDYPASERKDPSFSGLWKKGDHTRFENAAGYLEPPATASVFWCLIMTTKTKGFSVGDLVFVRVTEPYMRHFPTDFEGLVIERSKVQGRYNYGIWSEGTDSRWWYEHQQLSLVSKATQSSTIKAYRKRYRDG